MIPYFIPRFPVFRIESAAPRAVLPSGGAPLEQVLRLQAGDLGDGGERVAQVGGRPLHAVPVVDLTLPRLLVNVELATQ